MSEFQSPADIGNRSLQQCGAARLDTALGLAEQSRNAGEITACYGKLRQAELRGNVWTFACKRAALRAVDTDTMLLVPALWVETTTYFIGSIVEDALGNPWISRIPDNIGLQPGVVWYAWEPYFGPRSVSLFDDTLAYYAGELVYTTDGDGTNRVYVSLLSGNEDDPATATAWDSTATYQKDDVITYSAVAYMSLVDLNTNNTPSASAAAWSSATTYALGNSVRGTDGVKYTSKAGGNLNHDPVLDVTETYWTNTGDLVPWATDFTGGTGAVTWRQIGGAEFPMGVTVKTLDIIYPLESGPASQPFSRNIFVMPANFLRIASQHPGSGITPSLGGPSGITYRDWVLENGFLVTADTGAIIYRFVADIQDVSQMDPMFCEGLAARIALELADVITQKTTDRAQIAKIYDEWMSRAKLQNAIEQGSDEPPDDDWITVRA